MTKVASVANATPGQTISYTVTLVNLGPGGAERDDERHTERRA
ncbi:MAG: hypothetical protein IPK34_12815 [Ramlibacter sp.]|nr:hypothetical protein [Ramlibacter sp.]